MEELKMSLPTRGAWIEIRCSEINTAFISCRSPHGERGLKLLSSLFQLISHQSLPTRGAWIEIKFFYRVDHAVLSRSPHGERGLK